MITSFKIFEKYINESVDDIYTVKIKPNINNKSKWYYGYINKNLDLTGKIIDIKKSKNPNFDNSFAYNDSQYIDIDDCDVLGVNLKKYNI